MDEPIANPNCPQCKALLELIEQLHAVYGKQIAELTARIEKVEREGKRQAAPFRKKRKADPKKPGRKSGDDHGKHHRRAVPEKIDETYDVPLPACCPGCGHEELTKTETLVQYQTEIPRTVIHRQFNIESGICCDCGSHVQGRHELQMSDAVGAASNQLGPNVHAAMALLNKELGLSHGKVKRLLEMLFEIHVSRSTSCRSMLRTADRLENADEQLRTAVRGSPQVVGDETGWRVDGRGAWLHAFVGLTATCYEVDPTRSIGPARRLLGIDWSGIFGHDGWAVYDQFRSATHQQCFAHLLRRCDSLIESGTGGALAFPRGVKGLLLQGFELRNRFRRDEMTGHGLKVMAGRLTAQMGNLVRRPKTHAGNERFAKFLENHLSDLFTFLRHPGADATNWRGEQAIRPAVVNRKVWGGNRTGAGAMAQSRINNNSKVVGNSTTSSADRGFIWEGGPMTDLGDLPTAPETTRAYAINDARQVVGESAVASAVVGHAFLWENDAMTDLGVLSGTDSSLALGLNELSHVVGSSYNAGISQAFLWDSFNGLRNLNDLLDSSGTGWTLHSASDINGNGRIVGVGTAPNGSRHAFLLTPVSIGIPEPTTLTLAVLGLLSLGMIHRRRRR